METWFGDRSLPRWGATSTIRPKMAVKVWIRRSLTSWMDETRTIGRETAVKAWIRRSLTR